MPILFKFSNKDSEFHGKGVFAEEDIPKGATWWTADNQVQEVRMQDTPTYPNIVWGKKSFEQFAKSHTLEQMAQILQLTMYYQDGNVLIYLRDGTGYMNHSFDYNSQLITSQDKDYRKIYSVALRDIKAGEQITQNYGNYTKSRGNWMQKVFKTYLPSRLKFEEEFQIQKVQETP